jgi:pilus assembly protein CpaD
MNMRNALRAGSVLAVLVAGSCAAPDEAKLTQDPVVNHPIVVEPSYRTLKLANSESLSREDTDKLTAFVRDYLANGSGSITVAAPSGPDAPKVIETIGEQLADLGVQRSRILVSQRDQTDADGHVEVGYIRYVARTAPCGNWSVDAADTADNLPMPNWGCSVQQNIAAQVVDPRDLVEPRGMDSADATRRMQILNKYEQGTTTQAQKAASQSAAVSDVGSSGTQ